MDPATHRLIDTHAHVFAEEFAKDIVETLQRARDRGVTRVIMPNIDHTSIDAMLELEHRYPGVCYATIGLHPTSVKKDFERELYIVEEWLGKRKFVALGEMGTDLYWDKTFWEQQKEAFAVQAGWAKKYELPLIIHCRETLGETIEMVEQLQDDRLRGVFHCFTGSAEQAERIVKAGFFLGIGGVSTFKKGGLDSVLPHVSLDHIVLETDSPYLAPVPHRGKRNEPAYVAFVAERVGQIMNVPTDEICTRTTRNALRLFPGIG